MVSSSVQRMVEGSLLGARVEPQGVHYRVWAPKHDRMRVLIASAKSGHGSGAPAERALELERDEAGYHSGFDPAGRAGDRYRFQFPDGHCRPDPASRFQPEGVHGPSECIDPRQFTWSEPAWTPRPWRDPVLYELHVGTFTPAGTFRAAVERLRHVRTLGATAIEIMPVADFGGARNWGYDGVSLFAPAHCYGRPDDFRALVDAAHQHDLAVILDVVYNHLGPDGNYLREYSDAYFSERHTTPWGAAMNFDGAAAEAVRELFLTNAAYWMDEFRVDGLRFDATHAIVDDSARHLLSDLAAVVHARGGFCIAEDERNFSRLVGGGAGGGFELDAVWSDDFHHQVRVALTGTREGYLGSYGGTAEDLAATLEEGWFFRGQPYPFWHDKPRGEPARHLPPSAFVNCIENHDQIGNRTMGERLEHLVSPSAFRAASVLLCLGPYVPMLFMGQEWGASAPFVFFSDFPGELGRLVSEGRKRECEAAGLDIRSGECRVPDPQAESTFLASRLSWDEIEQPAHAAILELYRECLRQRAQWLVGEATDRRAWRVRAFHDLVVLRFAPRRGSERLLAVTLTGRLQPSVLADPWLAPPRGQHWRIVLHTEERRFGGEGGLTEALAQLESDPGGGRFARRPEDVAEPAQRPAAATVVAGPAVAVLFVAEET